MACTFCATGRGGFSRSLLPSEILDQLLTVQEHFGRRATNVVFMGMGEPCLNLPCVMKAARAVVRDVGVGARRVTLSTVGVPGTIEKIARETVGKAQIAWKVEEKAEQQPGQGGSEASANAARADADPAASASGDAVSYHADGAASASTDALSADAVFSDASSSSPSSSATASSPAPAPPPASYAFAPLPALQLTFAISLHAPDQASRARLVPSAKVYPIEAILDDAQRYCYVTGRRVSFEYTLLRGENASAEDAERLADLIDDRPRLMAHVNLIPWNPNPDAPFREPDARQIRAFADVLRARNIPVSIRVPRGRGAAAACGQLRNEQQGIKVAKKRAETGTGL